MPTQPPFFSRILQQEPSIKTTESRRPFVTSQDAVTSPSFCRLDAPLPQQSASGVNQELCLTLWMFAPPAGRLTDVVVCASDVPVLMAVAGVQSVLVTMRRYPILGAWEAYLLRTSATQMTRDAGVCIIKVNRY